MNRAYRFVRAVVWPFQKILWRPRAYGLHNVPQEGPYVLCSNHISNVDPVLIACAVPVDLYFMGKAELFFIPVLGWILRKIGVFPVKRGTGDVNAVKRALTILKEGKVLAMFPEGTRVKDDEESPTKSGAAIFAIKGAAPILPVAVRGSMKLFSKNEVIFGEPFFLKPEGERPSREEFNRQAIIMMDVIRDLEKKQF